MEYRIAEEQDYEMVIDHLRKSFFEDEPLNKAVQLCPPGEGHEELEKQCMETMKDGYSIIAMENGEIMGASLNGVLYPGDTAKALAKLKTMDDDRFRKIFVLLYSTTDKLDIFNLYQVDSIMECRIMSVSSKARGKGLAGELLRRSIELAKEKGYKLFKGDATGRFSQRICEKNGMTALKEVIYKDYLDPITNEPVFNNVPPPHDTLKIMILKLTDN